MSKIYICLSYLKNSNNREESNFEKAVEADATILAKLEYFNLQGRVKDRVALAMIEGVEKKGAPGCSNYYRAYIRKHRYRSCGCGRIKGLQGNSYNA